MSMRERALRQIKNIESCGCRMAETNRVEIELFLGGNNLKMGIDGHQHLPKRVSGLAKPRKSLKVHRQGKENGQVIGACFTAKEKRDEMKNSNTNHDNIKVFTQNGGYHNNSMKFNFTMRQKRQNRPIGCLKTRLVFQNRIQSDITPSVLGQKHTINYECEQNSTINSARNEYSRLDKANDQCRLAKIQSSQNLLIPQFSSFKNSDSNKISYFSQFGHQNQGSSSKVTHKLSDLNFKCTESVKDSNSPAISEIISDSDSSFSEKPKDNVPVKFKDLKMRKIKMGEVYTYN